VIQWIALDNHESKLCLFNGPSLNFLLKPCHIEDAAWYSLMNNTF
jgi:hypothetical protein